MNLSADTILTLRLGRLFREKREKLGLSTRQIAEATNISTSQINRIENGALLRPTLTDVLTLIRFFQLPLDTLLGETPDDSNDPPDIDTRLTHLDILMQSIKNQAEGQDLDALLGIMQGFLKYLNTKKGAPNL